MEASPDPVVAVQASGRTVCPAGGNKCFSISGCVQKQVGDLGHTGAKERERERTCLTGKDDSLEGMFAFKEHLRVCVNSGVAGWWVGGNRS